MGFIDPQKLQEAKKLEKSAFYDKVKKAGNIITKKIKTFNADNLLVLVFLVSLFNHSISWCVIASLYITGHFVFKYYKKEEDN